MRYALLAILITAAAASARAATADTEGGGCFPAGTLIETTAGKTPIEKIHPGDRILAFSGERLVQADVKSVYGRKDRLLVIRTGRGSLKATADHPLLTRNGFKETRDLKKGMKVAFLAGGHRVWVKIKAIEPGGVSEVYNLEAAPPHTFIADGFIVHNKGGGDYAGGSGHTWGPVNYFVFLPAVIGVYLLARAPRLFRSLRAKLSS